MDQCLSTPLCHIGSANSPSSPNEAAVASLSISCPSYWALDPLLGQSIHHPSIQSLTLLYHADKWAVYSTYVGFGFFFPSSLYRPYTCEYYYCIYLNTQLWSPPKVSVGLLKDNRLLWITSSPAEFNLNRIYNRMQLTIQLLKCQIFHVIRPDLSNWLMNCLSKRSQSELAAVARGWRSVSPDCVICTCSQASGTPASSGSTTSTPIPPYSSFLPRLADQVWQADSFSFQCIKGTFLLWQPALFCHLLAGASHYSGQPLRLDRPLSLPIILSVDPTLPPLSMQTHFPTSAIIFFDKPSISFNFKALSTDTHCYSSVPFLRRRQERIWYQTLRLPDHVALYFFPFFTSFFSP